MIEQLYNVSYKNDECLKFELMKDFSKSKWKLWSNCIHFMNITNLSQDWKKGQKRKGPQVSNISFKFQPQM